MLTVRADSTHDAGITQITPAIIQVHIASAKNLSPASLRHRRRARHRRPLSARSVDRPAVRRGARALRLRQGFGGTATRRNCSRRPRDTRESGDWIEAELAHGASGEGATVTSAGVVPTPAIAYLTRTAGYDAGVVISASHNPFEDNGIKVFSGRGEKFTERVEREVEAIVADTSWNAKSGEVAPGPAEPIRRSARYLDHLRARVSRSSLAAQAESRSASTALTARRQARRCLRVPRAYGTVSHRRTAGRPASINLSADRRIPNRLAADRGADRRPDGRGVRRRRRPRDFRRSPRRGGRGRRRPAHARTPASSGRPLTGRGHRRDRHEQHRPGAGAARRSASNLLRCRSRRQMRDGRNAEARPVARRRTVGPHHFPTTLFTGDGLCTALNVLRTVALGGRTLADPAADLVNNPQVLLNVRVREKVDLASVPAVAGGDRARRSAPGRPGAAARPVFRAPSRCCA